MAADGGRVLFGNVLKPGAVFVNLRRSGKPPACQVHKRNRWIQISVLTTGLMVLYLKRLRTNCIDLRQRSQIGPMLAS